MSNNNVIVIGGGPAGLGAAGKLKDFGFDVVLIEKQSQVGGHLDKWFKVFPDFTDASEITANLRAGLGSTKILMDTTVREIKGSAPDFWVTTSQDNKSTSNSCGYWL